MTRQTLNFRGCAFRPGKITALSFAVAELSLPKLSVMVARMEITATPALAAAVADAMGPLTHDEIYDKGGPTSPTMTKILRGEGEPISGGTARKLEIALGWPRGRVAAIAAGKPSEDIRQLREASGMTRFELAQLLGVGSKSLGAWEAGDPMPPQILARLRAVLAQVPYGELIEELRRRDPSAG